MLSFSSFGLLLEGVEVKLFFFFFLNSKLSEMAIEQTI